MDDQQTSSPLSADSATPGPARPGGCSRGRMGGRGRRLIYIWTRGTIREASGGPPRSAAPAGHRYPQTGPGHGLPGGPGTAAARRRRPSPRRPGSSPGGPPLPSGTGGMPVGRELGAESCGPSPRHTRPRLPFPGRSSPLPAGRPSRRDRGPSGPTQHPGPVSPGLRVGRNTAGFRAAGSRTGDRKAIPNLSRLGFGVDDILSSTRPPGPAPTQD